MTTISSFWLLVLIELLVVTSVVAISLIAIRVVKNKKDRDAANKLVQKIKEDTHRRREETQRILQKNFGFDEDKAREIASLTVREEKKFYQNTINFYLKRDAASFGNLDIDYEAAVDSYRVLKPPGLGGGEGSTEAPVNESEEIKRLKIENQRLSDEVAVTMNTMSRMLDEYSSMFAGGSSDEEEKEEALNQMKENLGLETGDSADEPEEEPGEELGEVLGEELVEEAGGEEEPGEELLDEIVDEVPEEVDSQLAQMEAEDEAADLLEEMDDLSDLDPIEDDPPEIDKHLDDPDELIG